MSTNTFMLFIAALCLAQGIRGQSSSLDEVVADALKKTQSSDAQSAAQEGANELQAIAHSLIISGQDVLTNSRGVLQNISDTLNDAVHKIIGDVPQCVNSQQSVATQLFLNTSENLVKCVTVEVEKVGTLIKDVASLAHRAVLLPQEAANNVTACLSHPLTIALCVTKAVGKWKAASESITAEVTAVVQTGRQLLLTGPGNIFTCALAEVDNVATQINQIIVNISQCIVDGSKTSSPSSNSTGY